MIQVRGLTKRFGGRTAVRNVTFQAPDAAITGLLGTNGAGKTTTLRMIAGALRPNEGHVSVGDATLGPDNTAVQRRLGSLLDHSGLYGRLTARENIEYFGRLRGLDKQTVVPAVERVLTMLRMHDLADRPVGEFSQGERMKVALARVMVHSPRNVLLDEPTNGLDVPSARHFKSILHGMRDRGACIVFSSHLLSDVSALCDNVVIVSRGRMVAQGEPRVLCQQAGCATLEEAFLKLTRREEALTCLPV